MREIAVTATGLITVAGLGAAKAFAHLEEGHLSLKLHNECVADLWPVAKMQESDAPWPNVDPWWVNNRKFCPPWGNYAVNAALAAVDGHSALEPKSAERSGIIIVDWGSAEEGDLMVSLAAEARGDPRPLATFLYDEAPDYTYLRSISSLVGQYVARATGYRGSNVASSTEGSAGGLGALAMARDLLLSDELDRVLVVGVSTIPPVERLCAIDASDRIARRAGPGSAPFDAAREGTLLGEAAVAMLLETEDSAKARKARVLARLVGCASVYAQNTQAALKEASKRAVRNEQSAPAWWAHGAGSRAMDALEHEALAGQRIGPVTASKSGLGNALECAGLVDAVLAVEALQRGVLPPIPYLSAPDTMFEDHDFVMGRARNLGATDHILVTALSHIHPGFAAATLLRKGDGDDS